MTQFTANTDLRLNAASRKIGEAKRRIEEATQDHDKFWEEVVSLFGELAEADKNPRFLADDGHFLTYQRSERSPTLNEEMLQSLIFQTMPKAEATKVWNSITKRSVDSTALEAAVRMKKIPSELVEQCLKPGTVSYSRIRKEWTKEDRERATILGIEIKS